MLRIPLPTDAASATYALSISKVRNPGLRTRFLAEAAAVAAAATEYSDAAVAGQLHLVQSHDSIGNVTKDEMIRVYDNRMAKKKSPGRTIYDRILGSAPHGKCPYCALRTASTLDHFLPKTDFPIFSVVPINLVPSCKDCNHAKLGESPGAADELMLHPYYDNLGQEQWLFAEVEESTPPSIKMYVDPPVAWPQLLGDRVARQFEKLELGQLYSTFAAEELLNKQYALEQVLTHGSPIEVRAHLIGETESYRAVRVNSWQSALYFALSENHWFCEGGFRDG